MSAFHKELMHQNRKDLDEALMNLIEPTDMNNVTIALEALKAIIEDHEKRIKELEERPA